MRAVTFEDRTLTVAQRPVPELEAPDDVIVRVHGAGLNRGDLAQRAGAYPAPPGAPPDIPGLEFAGVVHAAGPAAGLDVGTPVFGITAGGAQAEYVRVPAAHCARVPEGFDLVTMGGVPEAFITAHDALVTQAQMRAGDWVVIHAVGSGVGTAGVQLAHALGARVAGTARSAEKLERCAALGLDAGIVPPTRDDGTLDVDALAAELLRVTGHGADVVLDLVCGPYVEADVAAAASKGRIVLVGMLAGAKASLSIAAMMGKRLTMMGTLLRPRDKEEKAAAVGAFARDVVPLLAAKTIEPIVEAVVPLDDAAAGYELLASNATFGKVILDCRAT